MGSRRWNSNERRKDIHARRGSQKENNTITPRHPSRRAWREIVKDDEVVKAVEEMKRAGVKMLRDEEWREVDGIMYKERKVYVPKDNKLRAEIIRLHHDTPVEGHGGQWKMVELVTQNFWWPGITKEVKQYVDTCQRNKNHTEQPVGKLMPNSISEKL